MGGRLIKGGDGDVKVNMGFIGGTREKALIYKMGLASLPVRADFPPAQFRVDPARFSN